MSMNSISSALFHWSQMKVKIIRFVSLKKDSVAKKTLRYRCICDISVPHNQQMFLCTLSILCPTNIVLAMCCFVLQ